MRRSCGFSLCVILFIVLTGDVSGIRRKSQGPKRINEEKNRTANTFLQTVRRRGYVAEEHNVITEDGYILGVHRITGNEISPPVANKAVILLISGWLATSDLWLVRGQDGDLVSMLVDEGFDTWFLNPRGNSYSRSHTRLSPEKPEFWQFSWHEMGIFDLAAVIDYTVNRTGRTRIHMLGHSMGGTIGFVLLSMRPEYNEKIDIFATFAPTVGFNRQSRNALLRMIGEYAPSILRGMRRKQNYEFLAQNHRFIQFVKNTCKQPLFTGMCGALMVTVTGKPEYSQVNKSITLELMQNYPSGTSVYTLDHFLQHLRGEDFRLFDFGSKMNMIRYGSIIPPKYPLERVTAKILIYYSIGDPLATPTDIRILEQSLVNAEVMKSREIPYLSFNHMDFVFSNVSKKLVNEDLIGVLKKLEESRESLRNASQLLRIPVNQP